MTTTQQTANSKAGTKGRSKETYPAGFVTIKQYPTLNLILHLDTTLCVRVRMTGERAPIRNPSPSADLAIRPRPGVLKHRWPYTSYAQRGRDLANLRPGRWLLPPTSCFSSALPSASNSFDSPYSPPQRNRARARRQHDYLIQLIRTANLEAGCVLAATPSRFGRRCLRAAASRRRAQTYARCNDPSRGAAALFPF